jgi:Na+/H+-dicarboxylate symporter
MLDQETSALGRQESHLRGWIRNRLWAQVLIGLVLGILVGSLLSPDADLVSREAAEGISNWLALPGRLFLGLITMVLVPLVFVSILQGLIAPQNSEQLRSIGLKLAAFILATTVAAAILGVILAQMLQPGSYITGFEAVRTLPDVADPQTRLPLPDYLVNLIPVNPARSIMNQDMLAIVILAILLGIASRQVARERIAGFFGFFQGLLEISMLIVKWAMYLTPYAVLGLSAQLIAEVGFSSITGMSIYMLTVILGLAGILLFYLLAIAVLAGSNPWAFLKAIAPVQLLAFSTSSSAAVMPLSIETATGKLGVPASRADLIIPLGATMNMAGTALYQAVAVLFLAQMVGVELSAAEITTVVATLVLSSIGAPGTPGVSIAILTTVVASLGIPIDGMVLILGVDRLLDMCRTVVNVTGDLTACALLKPKWAEDVAAMETSP